MTNFGEHFLSSEFSSLLSNTLTSSGLEQLFGIAFVFTVETGFIPISLAEHFDSVNSNIELAKMINSLPLNSFWHQNYNIFNAQLVMSNQLCYLTGISHDNSLIITLCYLNTSKCSVLEIDSLSEKPINFSSLSFKYKNLVSVPIKCAILSDTIGQYPGLCGIPEEVILYVMTKLNPSDLYALMQCCKKMNHLATNNQILWKNFVDEEMKKTFRTSRITIEQWHFGDWRNYYYELKKKTSGRRRISL